MIRLKVTDQFIELAEVTPLGYPLVANSIGEYECIFEFDYTWEDFLVKTAVFEMLPEDSCEKSKIEPVVLDRNNRCYIPASVLKDSGSRIRIGVYGIKGNVRRPTIYTEPLKVRVGAMPVSPENDPTPQVYIQLVNLIEDVALPRGGTTDQVLTKGSDNDYDVYWADQTGGSGGATSWGGLRGKPFDELNPNEMEVTGEEGNTQLGVKEIAQAKVTGLTEALGKIPTKTSQLLNDSKFVDQTALDNIETKVDKNTEDIALKADKTELPTKTSELTNDSDFTTNAKLTQELNKKLNLIGGTMQGAIDMASFGISNLPDAVANGDAVNKKQLDAAIAGIGTVFNLKGSKPTFGELPELGNKIGDVWFVEDESAGYIWIEKSGVPQWEEFGPSIDLSGYLTKKGLLQTTGSETENAMSQDATTKELKKKLDSTELPTAINEALAQAKASGEFDGKDGDPGKNGSNGGYYTPTVSQPEASNMQVAYQGSIPEMPSVPPVTVNLPKGKDGFAPTVSVQPIENGNKVTITDANGPKEFDVTNGTNGRDGKDATFGYKEVSTSPQVLDPNTRYKFTVPLNKIDITLKSTSGYAEYDFVFTTASDGCNLGIPVEVQWNGDKAPTLEANKKYEVVISEGIAYIGKGVSV